MLGIGVDEELADGVGGGAVQLVVACATRAGAEAVKLAGDLGGWSGQGAAGPDDHDLGAAWV